uniref:Secreted protein n=1 Tax=Plectus sambesii TaxID=2011161 RepID=A0A914UMJ4_9BILA
MVTKRRLPFFLIPPVIAFEVFLLSGSWLTYRELRNSSESRLWFRRNFPRVLDWFYGFEDIASRGQLLGSRRKTQDLREWTGADKDESD